MVQSGCSRAQSRRSCRWPLVSLGIAQVQDWVVFYVAPYLIMSTQQCDLIHFYLALHCAELSAEPMYGSGFASPSGQSPTTFNFFDNVTTSNTMSSNAGFFVIYPLCLGTNICRYRTTQAYRSFGNTCSEPLSHKNLVSIKVAYICSHSHHLQN